MVISKAKLAVLRTWLDQLSREQSTDPAYKAWRKRFLQQRLQLGLQLAVAAYLSFILLELVLTAAQIKVWDPGWLVMASVAELGLITCLVGVRSPQGKHRLGLLFLGGSWSITLVEQVWATLNGFAFPGLFAWTLVLLTQATLVPVRWYLHLISQVGLLTYYFGVNTILNLYPNDGQPLWDPIQVLYLLWFCGICDLAVFLYERLQRTEFQTRRELEAEQEKSERLLLNILPEAIAQQLKQDHRTIAESFAEATVLFADIVGFTQISAGIPPRELVTLLNQIFSTFDQLAEQHNLEKIKTIGDAYMVVGGLPIERGDHVESIASMALDMQAAIAQFKTRQDQPFRIRIGINTGPVVAGVIGRKKFIYDLWGDTVNIASRMESQGLPGCIQVTKPVYERLQDKFLFEERGILEIKGKGKMQVYLLQDRLL
ncbi:adenylate/guanylate cyclase domain-containing protein [Leptolyngbya sp. FACHB-671]|uniref:adenylate/guanylate cyclase domain-containing protein n=1 Tax=Leptolyngbya sp. FACHB-671 TaxID=2692812 RepID=UPI001688DD0F